MVPIAFAQTPVLWRIYFYWVVGLQCLVGAILGINHIFLVRARFPPAKLLYGMRGAVLTYMEKLSWRLLCLCAKGYFSSQLEANLK